MSIPTGPYAALKIPDFRLFVSARFCVTLAIQIQAVIVAWQVYEITKDPLSLGLIGLAEAIPSIGVSLYAGHVADCSAAKKNNYDLRNDTPALLISLTFFYIGTRPIVIWVTA